jgi:hypothetical protein
MKELPSKEKASHREVKYEFPSDHAGQACADCKHVIHGTLHPRCQTVADPIFLVGWCIRYEEAEKKK